MAFRIGCVTAVLFVPLAQARGLVHFLDDLPPADAGVVCAKTNFAFLRSIRNNAHLGAAKIVVKEVLKPHSLNAQHPPIVVAVRILARTGHAVIAIGICVGR